MINDVTKHNECLETVVTWALSLGLSTGHADTIEDLIGELDSQIRNILTNSGKDQGRLADD